MGYSAIVISALSEYDVMDEILPSKPIIIIYVASKYKSCYNKANGHVVPG